VLGFPLLDFLSHISVWVRPSDEVFFELVAGFLVASLSPAALAYGCIDACS
jgi:hypothetical protein